MANKVNPFLAQFEARLQSDYRRKLEINTELDSMAVLQLVHDKFKVGPGRAEDCLLEFLHWKMVFAEMILDDCKDDPEIIKTKHDLAMSTRGILGDEAWEKNKNLFPLLSEYW